MKCCKECFFTEKASIPLEVRGRTGIYGLLVIWGCPKCNKEIVLGLAV